MQWCCHSEIVGLSSPEWRCYRTAISNCLNRAVLDGLMKRNPALSIKPPVTHTEHPKKAKPLTDEEYDKLIEWCTKPARVNKDGSKDLNDLASRGIRDMLLFIDRKSVV